MRRFPKARRFTAQVLIWTLAQPSVWSAAPPVVARGSADTTARIDVRVPTHDVPPADMRPASLPAASGLSSNGSAHTGRSNRWNHCGHSGFHRDGDHADDHDDDDDDHSQPCSLVFGPQRYTRTAGAPNVFTATVTVPAWITEPYHLHVQNGDEQNGHRTSSATIDINGRTVARPDDFSQNDDGFDRLVSLTATTTVRVRLSGTPGSYVILSICGGIGDRTRPVVSLEAPQRNSIIGDATPTLTIAYRDDRGSGESVVSGVDLATLKISIDGSDRTWLFTKTATQATGTLPDTLALADGSHIVAMTIADRARNSTARTASFFVDATAPRIRITSPTPNAVVTGPRVEVAGTVDDVSAVTVDVNGQLPAVSGNVFTAQVPVTDGSNTIRVTARDVLDNVSTAEVTILVDSSPPSIVVSAPAEGTVTSAASIALTGTVTDPALARLEVSVDGSAAAEVPVSNATFSTTVSLGAEGAKAITLVATDRSGNRATSIVHVIRDITPPELQIVTPQANAVVGGEPVSVSGLVHDATAVAVKVNGIDAARPQDSWTAQVPFASEGSHTLTVAAIDAAGNQSAATRVILLDLNAPVVTIDAPEPGSLTTADRVTVRGRVSDATAATVVVGTVAVAVAGGGFSADMPLDEGDNHVRVLATDALGRTAAEEVVVTRDSIAPSVEIDAPGTISRLRGARATLTASDTLALARVVVSANGVPLGTFTSSSFGVDLTVPDSVAAGAHLTVTATAFDTAGNSATATRSLRVIADGVIVGQALADNTGLPLAGATVRMNDRTLTTDERGGYSVPAMDVSVVVTIEHDGMTTVERLVPIQSGVGVAVVDARLTPLAPPTTVDAVARILSSSPAGQGSTGSASVAQGFSPAITITVPANAFLSPASVRLTSLSPQGLPALLPLGWSPLAAFDLRSSGAASGLVADAAIRVSVPERPGPGAEPLAPGVQPPVVHLVQYQPSVHAWVMATANVPVTGGVVSVPLAPVPAAIDAGAPTAFAFVVADEMEPPIAIADPDQPLTGVPLAALPAGATSAGAVTPAILPPAGGTAIGLLAIQSPSPVPSGTVVRAQVTETFTLASGDIASEETRGQDLVLYRVPAAASAAVPGFTPALSAYFPITPSRSFTPSELVQGRVHLDILAGREAVRGQTGGSEAVTLTTGGITLTVPAHALPEDTAISVQPAVLSTFLPGATDLQPVAEIVVDLSGNTLTLPAGLSMSASSLTPGPTDRFFLARVERIEGIPRLAVVALADVAGDRLVSRAAVGLAGVTRGGRYIFYRSSSAFGFIASMTSAAGTPISSIVSADRWPFIARGDGSGHATLLAPEGAASVSARVPGTALAGSTSAAVAASEITPVAIALSGAVTVAVVTPGNGAIGVPPTTQIEIETTAAISPASLQAATVRLTKGEATVPVRLILAGSGRSLAIVPQARLDAGAMFQLDASGLVDVFGSAIAVPATSFTTATTTTLAFNPKALVVSFPNADGVVEVTAPAGSLQPGTNVLIVNAGSGDVVSFTAGNDGSLHGTLNATIDHRLIVTITDPQGQATTFERSHFVAPDGATAVGAGGGTVEGEGGIELRVPEGAVDQGVVLKIEPFGAELLPTLPDLPGAHFGSGIKIGSTKEARFKKEVDLAFPVPAGAPANPKDAFYYVYRRIEGPNGQIFYETIDEAFVEGTGAGARVVTASYPFTGYKDGWNRWDPTGGGSFGLSDFGAISNMGTCHALLMWTVNALLPGRPVAGVITGRVLRPRFEPGSIDPVYDGVGGVKVQRDDPFEPDAPSATIALTQADGRFTFFDPHFTSGNTQIRVDIGTSTYRATAFQVAGLDTKILSDDALGALIRRGHFSNIAFANITLPPEAPPPPAPQIRIRVFTETNGVRRDTDSLVIAGTPLIIGFSALDGTVRGATINGEEFSVHVDPLQGQASANGMDAILDQLFTPAQPGSYTITGVALPPFGPPVSATKTFRVIASGGGTNTSVPGRPGVLTVTPRADSAGVPVGVFAQVAFTEPVTHVTSASVRLEGPEGTVPVRISGVAVDPSGSLSAVDEVGSGHVVTSLTLVPLVGLRYGAQYHVTLTEDVIDRDQPAPQTLVPFHSSFTTFGPEALGGSTETPRSAGLVVLGDRAYLAETLYAGGTGGLNQTGNLRTYTLTSPVNPEEIPPPVMINYPPRDIAGEQTAEERTVVVAMGPKTWFFLQGELVYFYEIKSSPSNLFAYDVSADTPRWIGAVNLTDNLVDGTPNRIVMKDGLIYAATMNKGIQVVDLEAMKNGFPPGGTTEGDFQLNWAVFRGGFNKDAIVASVAITEPANPGPGVTPYHLPVTDIKVGDFVVEGASRRLVLGTGPRVQIGLVVVDPIRGETVWRGPIGKDGATIDWGSAIALATIDGRPLALVGGTGNGGGTSTGLLAVVDLSPLADSPAGAPIVLSLIALPHQVGDILVKDSTAIVSGAAGAAGGEGLATLVDLTELSAPRIVGSLRGVGSRMALTADNLLLSTERSFIKGTPTELGGVRTAALDNLTVIDAVTENPAILALNHRSVEPQSITFRVIPGSLEIRSSELEITRNGSPVQTIPVTLDATGRGTTTLPAGFEYPHDVVTRARLVVNRDEADRPQPTERTLKAELFAAVPPGPTTIQVSGEPLDVIAANKAIGARVGKPRDPPYTPPILTWTSIGAPNAVAAPATGSSLTGGYVTELTSLGRAGDSHQFELRQGSTVLARTGAIVVTPGLAATAQLAVDRPGTPALVPADGTTVLNLTLNNIRDVAGNLVADGTPVSWRVVGDGGDLISADRAATGGGATARYRAGIELGTISIVAEVDGVSRSVHVDQRPLDTTLTLNSGFIEVVVTSAGGPPADGTPILWSTLFGAVQEAGTLSGGAARGRWVPSTRPDDERRQIINVFSSIGRSRGSLEFTRAQIEPSSELALRMDTERLMGDRTVPLIVSAPDGSTASIPAETTARIEGATPDTTYRAVLGTVRFPVYEPIAAFPFDAAEPPPGQPDEPAISRDVYGASQVVLSRTGVRVELGDAAYGAGSLQFTGQAPAATIVGLPALSSSFGFNLDVRFDSVTAGQTIVEKAGSYSLAVVDEQGSLRLEFSVTSGGVRKRVRSSQALAVETWYHVAARLKDGVLVLQVGDAENAQVGDFSGAADVTGADVTLGSALQGRMDGLRVYDFTRSPLATFANGRTVTDVLTDAAGRAELAVRSTGRFAAPEGLELAGPAGIISLALQDLPPVQNLLDLEPAHGGPFDAAAIDAQGAPGVLPEDPRLTILKMRFRMWTARQFTTGCVDALTSGEPATILGWVCEVGVGLTGVGGAGQGVRDIVFTAQNFIRSKGTKKDYAIATFGVAVAIVAIVPGARIVKQLIKAKVAVQVSEKATILVSREVERQAAKAVSGEVADTAVERGLLSLFDDAVPAATKQAAITLTDALDNPQLGREAFDRLAPRFGKEALVGSMEKVHDRFGKEVFERLLVQLDAMASPKLGDNALEGMALFLRDTGSDAKLPMIWTVIQGAAVAAPNQSQQAVASAALERLFANIQKGANLPDLKLIYGQLKQGLTGVKGGSNHLEGALELVEKEGFSIASLDRARPGYLGRPDVIATRGGKEFHIEFKNLREGASRLGDDDQLGANIKAAIVRARNANGSINEGQLADELSRIEYRIRGAEARYPELRTSFFKSVGGWLEAHAGSDFTGLANRMKLTFENKTVPF